MTRLCRLRSLSVAALWHAFEVTPGTPERRIREKRAGRIKKAYWAEVDREEAARARRVAAYQKRAGKVAA